MSQNESEEEIVRFPKEKVYDPPNCPFCEEYITDREPANIVLIGTFKALAHVPCFMHARRHLGI